MATDGRVTGPAKTTCLPDELDSNMEQAITNAFIFSKHTFTKLGRHQDRLDAYATRRQEYVNSILCTSS